jgi:hypothetical protein
VHNRRYLRDGADRSIQLEQLGRAQVPPRDLVDQPDEKPLFWPVFAAERRAMEECDIPLFTARASSDALIVSPGEEIEGCFQEPSFDLVLSVLEGLDDDDLEQQVAFIEGSMYAHLARETTASRPVTSTEEDDSTIGPTSDKAFVASALKVAEAIRSRAIRAEDGSAAWIAAQYLVQAERYQLQPMDYDLYGGTCGVAVFLAAAERFAPGSGYGELALAAVRPLQSMLDRRPDRLAETMGIGGAAGLGSVAYSLLCVSRLLDEPDLLEEARRIALLISEERIASDQVLDVIGGAAGTILGLTALYEAVPDREILERAIACGEHLLETRTENETGHRAWVTDEGLRTTGYSHGTAGIVYALLRLYEHTRDARLLETAKEAIAYEDTQYSPENRNWIDIAKPGEPDYKWQWCRGAPGIGLARLGGLAVLDTAHGHRAEPANDAGVRGAGRGSSLLRQHGPGRGAAGIRTAALAPGVGGGSPRARLAGGDQGGAYRRLRLAPDAAQAGGQPGLLPGHGRHRLRAAAHGPSRSAPFGALVGVSGDGRSRPQAFLSLARTAVWLQRRHGQPHTSPACSSLLVPTEGLKPPPNRCALGDEVGPAARPRTGSCRGRGSRGIPPCSKPTSAARRTLLGYRGA